LGSRNIFLYEVSLYYYQSMKNNAHSNNSGKKALIRQRRSTKYIMIALSEIHRKPFAEF
jgi:hypothetical protein